MSQEFLNGRRIDKREVWGRRTIKRPWKPTPITVRDEANEKLRVEAARAEAEARALKELRRDPFAFLSTK